MTLDKIGPYLTLGYAARHQAFLDVEAEHMRAWRRFRLRHFLQWTLPLSAGLVAFATMPLWLHWLLF